MMASAQYKTSKTRPGNWIWGTTGSGGTTTPPVLGNGFGSPGILRSQSQVVGGGTPEGTLFPPPYLQPRATWHQPALPRAESGLARRPPSPQAPPGRGSLAGSGLLPFSSWPVCSSREMLPKIGGVPNVRAGCPPTISWAHSSR